MKRALLSSFVVALCATRFAIAGPFENPGVAEAEIRVWADVVVAFQPTSSGSPEELASSALGRPDNSFVSLGELDATQIANSESPGSITLSLPYAIANGDGWDFAVFENAGQFFTDPLIYAELAYVEVSSNGKDFVRFPATSLNVEPGMGTTDTEITTVFERDFAGVNTTNISNLAGFHPAEIGTGFDLSDLVESATSIDIDLDSIGYIRIVDVPGNGTFLDAEGRGILDAWPSAAPSGGFDVDAVGTRYPVPEPNGTCLILLGLLSLGWLRR